MMRPRHRALGVGRMILVALRHVRPAIAGQIGDDQREGVGQLRRDAVPHHMRFGKAVQQQQRRSLAADAGENAPGSGVDPFGCITGIEVGEIGHGYFLCLILSSPRAAAGRVWGWGVVRQTRWRLDLLMRPNPSPPRAMRVAGRGVYLSRLKVGHGAVAPEGMCASGGFTL